MAQALLLAINLDVIANLLFFQAMDIAQHNMALLAGVESMQAAILIFTVVGEVLFLGGSFPQDWPLIGMFTIIAGMIATSLVNRNIVPLNL